MSNRSRVLSLVILLVVLAIEPVSASVPKAELPVVITSSGQSPDALMIKLLADQIQLENGFEIVLEADQLQGYKTLIIGIGGSVKGLGDAGINTDDEIERVHRLIAEAKDQGVLIVAMHTGGSPRRGDLADPFIHATAPHADFLVVRNDGNQDGLFTRIADEHSIPVEYVEQTMEVRTVLMKMFGIE
ncbi:MAG TPA: hypothetical protein DDZ66_15275 [Firmicutes bacterium]|nr:hypothetical protein [Bacillota bacterium]